jgi:hypothetical protein
MITRRALMASLAAVPFIGARAAGAGPPPPRAGAL